VRHLLAVIATLLAMIGTFSQARHAIRKAGREGRKVMNAETGGRTARPGENLPEERGGGSGAGSRRQLWAILQAPLCKNEAEREGRKGGSGTLSGHWWRAVLEAVFCRNRAVDNYFEVRHLRNTAALWLVIGTGALCAFTAEIVDAFS
jgi:hypothetical protein